jgi:NhaA family Na+:H+ antiporter
MKKELNHTTDSSYNITHFINEESIGGIILVVVSIIAIAWANSPWFDSYHYIWHEFILSLKFGNIDLTANLHHWINDGLMALFFFVIGLEIKREVMAGELSSRKKAFLPIMAAIGGMVIPALFYVAFNYDNPTDITGWGIPMATDIAFALGLLSIFGDKVPIQLKIFLTALAIADDLGAIIVIAVFYTESINYAELINAAIFIAILVIANRLRLRSTTFYGIIGLLGVWISFVFSGVHATLAGVLIAFTIPVHTKISKEEYVVKLEKLLHKFKKEEESKGKLHSKEEAHFIDEALSLSKDAHTPLQKLEHSLHPLVTYFILPLFALSNAGVHIEGSIINMALHPISIGIIVGLVGGKFIGITLITKGLVHFKMATLPEGLTWKMFYGMAMLAGIGFTMSMFISDLAFVDDSNVQIAKVGILLASLIAAVVGMILLSFSLKTQEANSSE